MFLHEHLWIQLPPTLTILYSPFFFFLPLSGSDKQSQARHTPGVPACFWGECFKLHPQLFMSQIIPFSSNEGHTHLCFHLCLLSWSVLHLLSDDLKISVAFNNMTTKTSTSSSTSAVSEMTELKLLDIYVQMVCYF